MTGLIVAGLALIIVVLLGLFTWSIAKRNRPKALRDQFGPEYDETVRRVGNRPEADAELANRRDRMVGVPVRHLRPEEQEQFIGRWRQVQAEFRDAPAKAVHDAQQLVNEVWQVRNFPMEPFDRQVEDLSVDHARVAAQYRTAHEIAGRAEGGQANPEDMRSALDAYRTVFEELVEAQGVQ
jgi:hypothetical protein